MEPIKNEKKSQIKNILASVPSGHILLFSALSLALLTFVLTPEKQSHNQIKTTKTIKVQTFAHSDKVDTQEIAEAKLTTDANESNTDQITSTLTSPDQAYSQTNTSTKKLEDTRTIEQKVKTGDTLSRVFKRAGLNNTQMYKLLASPEGKKLTNIYPGHTLNFELDSQNTLVSLVYTKDLLHSYSYKLAGNNTYSYKELNRQPDIQTARTQGEIKHSLYQAGKNANLDDKLIMELANIFGWDVDFALDIRKGDSFKILYEERFLDGEKIGNGHILAAEFTNQGDTFRAVRYKDEDGDYSYYTPEGESMRKAFLRAPLDFRRISDNFNPKRLHPIHKTVRPHRGTDYAASTGTPVWASGDGKVVRSGYTKPNGNFVVIQHGNNIQTKYLHLNKRLVKTGQRVKQKQQIGTVGSTGYATGPHLHYEFLINGVHRNPRTIVNKLPKTQSIAKSDIQHFRQLTRPIIARLENKSDGTQYAEAEKNSSTENL